MKIFVEMFDDSAKVFRAFVFEDADVDILAAATQDSMKITGRISYQSTIPTQ